MKKDGIRLVFGSFISMFMCLLFVNPSVVSAQSKKQQIFILKGKLDSLNEENIRTMHDLEVSRKREIRNKNEIDSLKNVLDIQERKLNANKVSYESELKHLQHQLKTANLYLQKSQRDLDSIASLPENAIALSDSSRLAFFTKNLISPGQTISSGLLHDFDSDGYEDIVLILQDTILAVGDFYEGYIYKSPIILRIYFWSDVERNFVLKCSNSNLFEFWDLLQGESIDMDIQFGSLFFDHLGASGSHQQNEKISISFNKNKRGFFFDSYYYGEVLFRDPTQDYDDFIDFKTNMVHKSNGEKVRMNISPPSLENFPDTNWSKAMQLRN